MIEELLAMRGRLLIATGLGLSVAALSSCLDTVPEDECFTTAEEDTTGEIIIIYLGVDDRGECPRENSSEVRDAAKEANSCGNPEVSLRYVACGPRESLTSDCEYVAVYDGIPDDCSVIGRPFIVNGVERSAAACRRSDWSIEVEVAPPDDEDLRRQLAHHWTEVGCAEHAAVAAFARFCLQLSQLGAPPELLRDCLAAGTDEVHHARLAFGLASRFGGGAMGAGSLDTDGALGDVTLPSIILDVVLEGCLGETRAAAEARIAASCCRDPQLKAILERIAEDEERHAALAWRFIAWVLDARSGATTAPALREALRAALARGYAPEDQGGSTPTAEGRAWGLLSSERRREIDAQVRAHIVEPLGRALLSQHGLRLGPVGRKDREPHAEA